MKLLLCGNVQLGAVSTEPLDENQLRKWRSARDEKLEGLMEQALQSGAAYVALFGRLFAQERTSEAVIDGFFHAVQAQPGLQFLVVLDAAEWKRLSYRNDVPSNLHLLHGMAQDTYLDERIALRLQNGDVLLQPGDHETLCISRNAQGRFALSGLPEPGVIPSFEPLGFEDAQHGPFGYGLLEWDDGGLGAYRLCGGTQFAYKTIELKILAEDEASDILRKLNRALDAMEADTFLRITLSGRSAFGLSISTDRLKRQLEGRVFYAELYDNAVMDIDEEAFENDISLRSEFVRLALQDGSLSESERNRLICCGWNVLSGKEVAGE